MKVVLWGKGERSLKCLEALHQNNANIILVVSEKVDVFSEAAQKLNYSVAIPEDPNQASFVRELQIINPDLFILAGYGKILKNEVLQVPKHMCINLHGGKLPEYRGSSPMNWALINNEKSFGLSIFKVNSGVDTGEIIMDCTYDIKPEWTIKDLHTLANEEFPKMLVELLPLIEAGNYKLQKQSEKNAAYYPLRFPDDGLVLWDQMKAEKIHNTIRALTTPYPCAFTFFKNEKVMLTKSELSEKKYFGIPGRIYKHEGHRLLVCARDKCLWITEARYEKSGKSVFESVNRYESFLTVGSRILESMVNL